MIHACGSDDRNPTRPGTASDPLVRLGAALGGSTRSGIHGWRASGPNNVNVGHDEHSSISIL